jgi:hypothetical protein
VSNLHPILADSSALIGLCSLDKEVSDTVFSEIGITTTWTCYKEVLHKSENGQTHSLRKSAGRLVNYVESDIMDYPTHETFPGSPNAGAYNAGEKSIRIALSQHEEFDTVILYDDEAAVMLNRTQDELDGTSNEFNIEPPNFPLFLLSQRTGPEESITDDIFCNQTNLMLDRRDWINSNNEDIFWKYPINCS